MIRNVDLKLWWRRKRMVAGIRAREVGREGWTINSFSTSRELNPPSQYFPSPYT
jgi:hypothetical protein